MFGTPECREGLSAGLCWGTEHLLEYLKRDRCSASVPCIRAADSTRFILPGLQAGNEERRRGFPCRVRGNMRRIFWVKACVHSESSETPPHIRSQMFVGNSHTRGKRLPGMILQMLRHPAQHFAGKPAQVEGLYMSVRIKASGHGFQCRDSLSASFCFRMHRLCLAFIRPQGRLPLWAHRRLDTRRV